MDCGCEKIQMKTKKSNKRMHIIDIYLNQNSTQQKKNTLKL